MRKLIMLTVCFVVTLQLCSQSKKEVKLYKIKSTTVWNANNSADGTATPFKDEYKEFDNDGNVTLSIEYKSDGTIKNKITTKYNASGDQIEETEYDASGVLIKKTVYTYNANGDKTGEIDTDASGNTIKKIVYTYDSKGLKLTKQIYNAANILESVKKYIYEY